MAFHVYKTDDGRDLPLEYLPCSAITPAAGMALKLTSGQLAQCAAGDLPLYLSVQEGTEAVTAGDLIAVVRIQPDIIFATTASADMTGVGAGDKVQLSGDALQVTAEKGGAAEIVALEGTDPGDRVFVRFHTPAAS